MVCALPRHPLPRFQDEVRSAVNGVGARSGTGRTRSATNHSGWLTVTESHRDPIREAGSSPCLGSLPCLPALSCADTGQGGNSRLSKAPQNPPISRKTTARTAPSQYSPTLLITLSNRAVPRAARTTSPPHSTLTPGESCRAPADPGVRQTQRHEHPAEAHASPPRTGCAHPLSCGEADDPGEAD